VYEELVRVPMLIHFPRGEFGGRRVSAVTGLVDVMPTVLEYIGRPDLVRDCRGANLLPLVRGEVRAESDATRFCSVRINRKKYYRPFKESRGDVNVAMRRGRWKGIWNEESAALELYDLGSDALETHNLSAEEPEIAAQLSGDARAWLEECRASSRGDGAISTEALDEETKESLRALGYME
jgi:arylsulfatase A-like enzyme